MCNDDKPGARIDARPTFAGWLGGLALAPLKAVRRVHHDQRGTISILTVFCLLMFTMLLVMVVNVAKHADDKVKMQNAADAAAYSGGVLLARGMNTLAFSNHLLCDSFAMTAYLREGGERNAEELVPEILQEWEKTGRKFSQADFDKFKQLGNAILDKIPKEQKVVDAFGEMTEAASKFALPVFEYVLEERLIAKFQRTVIGTIPELAQQTTAEVAYRNGLKREELAALPQPPQRRRGDRGPQTGVLWRMNIEPVAYSGEDDPLKRTLPVVDPNFDGTDYSSVPYAEKYFRQALHQREELARHYLESWTRERLIVFHRDAEMSQFINLWRIFTVAHLELLLAEYPSDNLPMVIRYMYNGVAVDEVRNSRRRLASMGPLLNEHMEDVYHFASVTYRKHLKETGPGLFKNLLTKQADAQTFAQVKLFLPKPRRFLGYRGAGGSQFQFPGGGDLGGTFGFQSNLPPLDLPRPPQNPNEDGSPPSVEDEIWVRENWPSHWDLLNQNWTAQLVPATAEVIPRILETNPGENVARFRLPNLQSTRMETIRRINSH